MNFKIPFALLIVCTLSAPGETGLEIAIVLGYIITNCLTMVGGGRGGSFTKANIESSVSPLTLGGFEAMFPTMHVLAAH